MPYPVAAVRGKNFGSTSSLLVDLESYWKIDETSAGAGAVTRVDSHGTNNLTDGGTTASTTGKINNGGNFVTADSTRLTITDNASVSTGDIDFTFSLWVNLSSKGAVHQGLLAHWAAPKGYMVYYDKDNDTFRFVVGDGGANTIGSVVSDNHGSPSTSTWYNIIAWHSATDNQVGITVNNGTADTAATSGAAGDSTTLFTIGAQSNPTIYADAVIDEVGFWKRLLTATEKADLYNGGDGNAYPF